MVKPNRKKQSTGTVVARKRQKRTLLKKPIRRFKDTRKRVLKRVNRTSVHCPVGAIVAVSHAEGTIGHVLEQLQRLPLREIIVIVHGSSDRTLEMARRHSRAILIQNPEAMEQDAVKLLAARISQSDFLLFIEGDKMVSADELLPFIQNVALGLENGTLVGRHELAAHYEHHYSYI